MENKKEHWNICKKCNGTGKRTKRLSKKVQQQYKITIAQFEKDGIFIVLAIFWIIFSILYFSLFVYGLYYLGSEGMQHLPEWALQFSQ